VLKDPRARQRYDSGVDLNEPEMGPGGMHGADVNQIFRMFMGGGGGGGGSNGMHFRFG